jgi:hypothetical protein
MFAVCPAYAFAQYETRLAVPFEVGTNDCASHFVWLASSPAL